MLKKGDIYLIAAVLLIAVAVMGYLKLSGTAAGKKVVLITRNGEIIKRIDLDSVHQPEKIVVEGEYTNTILIEKGRVRFHDSGCPNKDCVKTGWISDKGSVAVCLPNKTMIKIEGADEELDGATY